MSLSGISKLLALGTLGVSMVWGMSAQANPTSPSASLLCLGLSAKPATKRPPTKKSPPAGAPAPKAGSEKSSSDKGADKSPEVSVTPRGPTRIDFDDRLIQGQTNKSGAVYLFDRKELAVRSMVHQRTSFREQIVQDILTE